MKKRKTNKAKRSSSHCKNHGSCTWCEGNRLYQIKKEIEKSVNHTNFYNKSR